jgi:hypothetical protein
MIPLDYETGPAGARRFARLWMLDVRRSQSACAGARISMAFATQRLSSTADAVRSPVGSGTLRSSLNTG